MAAANEIVSIGQARDAGRARSLEFGKNGKIF